jgi:putative oxidoreductase
MIQRLFSTFPDSAPGAGLLLLRFCVGTQLMVDGVRGVLNDPSWFAHGLGFAQLLSGSLLIAGLWTPPVSACAALLDIGLAFLDGRWELHLVRSSITLGLIGLGPGAWSVDARLYGRKQIDV